jgi:phage portal protein BeeE
MTPKDMDFIEAKNVAAREIALAIGVPPVLRHSGRKYVFE